MKLSRKSLLVSFAGLALAVGGAIGAGKLAQSHAQGRAAALLIGELCVEGDGLLPAHSREQARTIAAELGSLVGDHVKARADLNGDGALDQGELDRAKTRLREVVSGIKAAALVRFDTDQDGALDAQERERIVSGIRARLHGAKQAADTNADGSLSDDEIRAAAKLGAHDKEQQDRLAASGIAPLLNEADRAHARELVADLVITVRAGLLENFDEDKDGKLGEGERAALKERAVARGKEIRAAAVAAADTDGDGSLDGHERRALAAKLARSWMNITSK